MYYYNLLLFHCSRKGAKGKRRKNVSSELLFSFIHDLNFIIEREFVFCINLNLRVVDHNSVKMLYFDNVV